MSSYASAAQMGGWFGWQDMARAAAQDKPPYPTAELFKLTVEGGDRSSFSADETTAADAALVRLQSALDDATTRMNGYLVGRYTLPLDASLVAGSDLPRSCGAITRYLLRDDNPSEQVTQEYKDAIARLKDISTRKASLGPEDSTPASATVAAPGLVSGPGRLFTRQTMGRW